MNGFARDLRGDEYGYVAIVFARGSRKGFTTALMATREAAASAAFMEARTLERVMTERRYIGKPCGGDIRWLHRRDLLPPLTALDREARAASIPQARE